MEKRSYFQSKHLNRWPTSSEIDLYLLSSHQRQGSFASGIDGGNLVAEGLYGTESLEPLTGRVDVYLYYVINPHHGFYFQYTKWDGRISRNDTYNSKGDLKRLKEFVRSLSGTPLSLDLFVPFEWGGRALKEFIESGGELPKSIAWIPNGDLPPEAFPLP